MRAKEFLSQNNIAYEEKDVSRNRALQDELMEVAGKLVVPTLVIDGGVYVGFSNNREQIEQKLGV